MSTKKTMDIHNSVATQLSKLVKVYFRDESHMRDFEKWYEAKYGEEYKRREK